MMIYLNYGANEYDVDHIESETMIQSVIKESNESLRIEFIGSEPNQAEIGKLVEKNFGEFWDEFRSVTAYSLNKETGFIFVDISFGKDLNKSWLYDVE